MDLPWWRVRCCWMSEMMILLSATDSHVRMKYTSYASWNFSMATKIQHDKPSSVLETVTGWNPALPWTDNYGPAMNGRKDLVSTYQLLQDWISSRRDVTWHPPPCRGHRVQATARDFVTWLRAIINLSQNVRVRPKDWVLIYPPWDGTNISPKKSILKMIFYGWSTNPP